MARFLGGRSKRKTSHHKDGPRRMNTVFLDVDLDVSDITPQNVSYQTGIAVPDFSALGSLDLTGVLLGHMALPT